MQRHFTFFGIPRLPIFSGLGLFKFFIFWDPISGEMKQKEKIMRNQKQSSSSSFSSSLFHFLILLVSFLIISQNVGFLRVVEGGKSRVHIPDELDDVIDDEEDEAWKNWGKKSNPSTKFDPPPSDLSKMELSDIQAEMMKRNVGPSFGFVKLRWGVHRSQDSVAEIAMKWTNVLKTGAIDAKFMAVDVSTIMFTMEKGIDAIELKEFVLSQPEAYEIKIGDQIHRRTGDPPLGDVIEMLRSKEDKANEPPSLAEDPKDLKVEL